MKKTDFLKTMMRFVCDGGQIALKNMDDSRPSLKRDKSVVTESDRAISKLARYALGEYLDSGNHILIDEESPNRNSYLDQKKLEKAEYIWSVDPIDGTRLYANRMPHWGVSLGLFKKCKPWLGVVYFPMLNELFYCDGTDAYFVRNAFLNEAVKTKIVPISQPIGPQSIVQCNEYFARSQKYKVRDIHLMVSECAVVDLCWPAIGRGCGAIFRSSIWDMAGSWPIFRAAGLDLRPLKGGRPLTKLSAKPFTNDASPWKVPEYYLLSSEKNYPIIKRKLGLK